MFDARFPFLEYVNTITVIEKDKKEVAARKIIRLRRECESSTSRSGNERTLFFSFDPKQNVVRDNPTYHHTTVC